MKNITEKIKSINIKYFISELLIVVVGILIALSLNNWREDNANKNKEQFYLKSLKTDFEQSLESLKEIINQNKESDLAVKKVLAAIHKGYSKSTVDTVKKCSVSYSALTGLCLQAGHTKKLFPPEVCRS